MDKKVTISIGGFFTTLLGIAFIVLKLCGQIDWAWVWVLAPIWVPYALALVFLVIGCICILIAKLIEKF